MPRIHDLTLSKRLYTLQWALPATIAVVAAFYQFGPARYVHDHFGDWSHYALEIFFYSTTGPLVTWFTLRIVRGWVSQKEQAEAEVYRLNAELQQRVEERTAELRDKNQALAAANERLQELDRLKSEFVSLVSHELRAPLTNLRGALELVEGECPTPNTTCLRMLGVLKDQAGRLERMVNEVLNVSRIEADGLTLACEAVDCVPIANRVIEEFAVRHSKRIFHRPGANDAVRLWANPDSLYEIILNLVDNAVRYSPADGPIWVSVEQKDAEGILTVSDAGPGIPAFERERIFEKFHRLDSGDSRETYGYGLGLYFCRRLVEAMQGRIWVESQPDRGATFCVALPLAESQHVRPHSGR